MGRMAERRPARSWELGAGRLTPDAPGGRWPVGGWMGGTCKRWHAAGRKHGRARGRFWPRGAQQAGNQGRRGVRTRVLESIRSEPTCACYRGFCSRDWPARATRECSGGSMTHSLALARGSHRGHGDQQPAASSKAQASQSTSQSRTQQTQGKKGRKKKRSRSPARKAGYQPAPSFSANPANSSSYTSQQPSPAAGARSRSGQHPAVQRPAVCGMRRAQ